MRTNVNVRLAEEIQARVRRLHHGYGVLGKRIGIGDLYEQAILIGLPKLEQHLTKAKKDPPQADGKERASAGAGR